MTVEHIFVYGTLRVGQGAYFNFGLDKATKHVGTFKLPDAAIFPLGGFPGVHLGSGPGVVGDLLLVEDSRLVDRLDQYEGCADDNGPAGLYSRRTIDVGGTQAYVYEYNGKCRNVIENGDWCDYHRTGTH